jgi:N-methylhydantoinase A
MLRAGVEVGGTFTDLVAVEGGKVIVGKVPSVPRSPDEGAYNALVAGQVPIDRIDDLVHGSTVATNAVLERKGARIAFVTTQGFRDVLGLQRHDRRSIYDLSYQKPTPLAARRDCFEVLERMLADGTVETPLDELSVIRLAEGPLAEGGYDAVAICLLNAYANPAHEQSVAELVRSKLPQLLVTCSSDVAREFREYERASTTVLAAYVQPVIARYLERFEGRLKGAGFHGKFSIMQSSGGRTPAEGMKRNAVTALFSGPAAGATGAARLAARAGYRNLITFDMGGTSTDVCLVVDGEPQLASETEIDGLPVRTPVLDIVSVGAGGGSVVWVDDGGMLRVGPRSTGADPGPACYGRGGTQPSVTDAHVIRGTIRPKAFLGGRMAIDRDKACAVFGDLATRFGMSLEEVADSAIRIAEANIVRAIQIVSTERGHDPRDYALLPFGGAGPLHAARIAEDLGIRTILVPPCAGVISAYGLLAADYVHHETATRRIELEPGVEGEIRSAVAEMQARAARRFKEIGIEGAPRFDVTAEMRFVGQAFEVPVVLPLDRLASLTVAEIGELFEAAHERLYRHGAAGRKRIEIVAFRLGAALPLEALPTIASPDSVGDIAETATITERRRTFECPVKARASIPVSGKVEGPLLLEDSTSTIYVPEGWGGEVDQWYNLVLRRIA